MNQKQYSSNQQKLNFSSQVTFRQAIKNIQFLNFKQQLQRKKQISIKNRLKNQWLQRIKIIPPRLNTADRDNLFRTTDSFAERQNDCFKMYRHNHYKKDLPEDDFQLLFQKRTYQLAGPSNQCSRQNTLERKSYNNTTSSFPKYKIQSLRQRKFKQNWKLAYRRDEINVLRFSTGSTKQGKFIKSVQIGQYLSAIASQQQKEVKQQPATKVLYKKLVNFEENENKQNMENKVQDKKQQKKFRLNLKKGKTSLTIKKQLVI